MSRKHKVWLIPLQDVNEIIKITKLTLPTGKRFGDYFISGIVELTRGIAKVNKKARQTIIDNYNKICFLIADIYSDTFEL